MNDREAAIHQQSQPPIRYGYGENDLLVGRALERLETKVDGLKDSVEKHGDELKKLISYEHVIKMVDDLKLVIEDQQKQINDLQLTAASKGGREKVVSFMVGGFLSAVATLGCGYIAFKLGFFVR